MDQTAAHFEIVMGLIGIMFLTIIGVYVWTFTVYKDGKTALGEIYRTVNGHLQDAGIHGDKGDYVSHDVCEALHTALKENVTEIKIDVKKILAKTA